MPSEKLFLLSNSCMAVLRQFNFFSKENNHPHVWKKQKDGNLSNKVVDLLKMKGYGNPSNPVRFSEKCGGH